MQLYGFWRSQATFRLRVALRLKGIAYGETPVDLDAGAQNADDFRAINPLGSVPALMVGDEALTQSLAIIEYLEETHPTPALLPSDPLGRARVRSLAAIAVSDSHTLIVPRVRRYLAQHAGLDAEQWKAWQTHWFTAGLRGYENRLAGHASTGRFCHGDMPGVADICLAGLVLGAEGFGIDVDDVPTVRAIVTRCLALEAFEQSRAKHQKDYPR